MDKNKHKRIWEIHKAQKRKKKTINSKGKNIKSKSKAQDIPIDHKTGLSSEQIREALKHDTLIKDINSDIDPNNIMRRVVDPRHGEISVTTHVYNLIQKDKEEWCPQRTPPWYAKRNLHVTASMMASVCNDNPYDSRASAVKKKTGAAKPFTGNAATAHGNFYEQEAIEKYEAATGQKALEFGLLESMNEGEEFLAGR